MESTELRTHLLRIEELLFTIVKQNKELIEEYEEEEEEEYNEEKEKINMKRKEAYE